MFTRSCETCGETFRTKYDYAMSCFPCYTARKNLIEASEDLLRIVEELSAKIPVLLQFCHPDKNAGREDAAKKLTQWLLTMRRMASETISIATDGGG